MPSRPQINFANRQAVSAKEMSKLADWVYRELVSIEKKAFKSSASFSTTTISGRAAQSGTRLVVAGTNTITFDTALPSANYALPKLRTYVSSSEEDNPNVVSKTASGFVCYCNMAGLMDFVAVMNA